MPIFLRFDNESLQHSHPFSGLPNENLKSPLPFSGLRWRFYLGWAELAVLSMHSPGRGLFFICDATKREFALLFTCLRGRSLYRDCSKENLQSSLLSELDERIHLIIILPPSLDG